jgi:peptidoglycan hydrolase-like protein with peptidoglycan-binding domain
MKGRKIVGLSLALTIMVSSAFGQGNVEVKNELSEKENIHTISYSLYKFGDQNKDIIYIQKALDELGFFSNSEYTEYFGYKTEQAVRDFQEANNMDVDGVVGKETIKYLYNKGLINADIDKITRFIGNLDYDSYENGDRSPDIKILQKALAQEVIFDSDEYTNFFGDVTEDSVKAFQKKYNLQIDGVVGKGTIDKLKELGYITNNNVVSRGGKINGRYGEYLSWSKVKKMVNMKNTVLTIEDFYTGRRFKVMASYGSSHIDIEMLTAKDSSIVKQLWGGSYSWSRRPVLVYINNRVIAASMNGMPHAGREDSPEGATVSNRSGDFGRGYNYDYIKGNNISGVACLHFKDSTLHKANRVDPEHKKAIMTAAGLL